MFKSKDEAYLKPSNFKSKSCILGIGNGFLLILLLKSLKSLKSEMKRTVPLYQGIKKVGAVHSELFLRFKTPMLTNLLTSVLLVSTFTFRIGNGLAWYGLAPSRSSILYPVPVWFPNVQSNLSSCFFDSL